MMVANGDKAIFRFENRGFCLYRTIGPYLVVFADPVVASDDERDDFLNALFAFSAEIDRRPLFYQISLEWIPPLHDRGYAFFKLGEEALVRLDRATLDGARRQNVPAGSSGVPSATVCASGCWRRTRSRARLGELRDISDEWLACERPA